MATEKQIIKLLNLYLKAAKSELKDKPEPCTTREMTLYLMNEIELIKKDIEKINNGELTLKN